MKMALRGFIASLFLTVILDTCYCQHNVIQFTQSETDDVVRTHNDLRRSIYNAANMRELTWNEGLAMAASEWGQRCQYISRPDNQWGQNMNYFYGRDYHKTPLEQFKLSFQAWSNETMHYDYRRFRYCGSKNVCSYVQLIAADVQQLGCTIVRCPKLNFKDPVGSQSHAKLLLCFYSPWVNILDTEVFIPEKRCSACPQGTVCVDNLCSARFHTASSSSIGSSQVRIGTSSISGEVPSGTIKEGRPSSESRVKSKERGSRRKNKKHRKIGVSNKIRYPDSGKVLDGSYGEHRQNPETYALQTGENDTIIVYTQNNKVIPFPGRAERRDIRKIEKILAEDDKKSHKKKEKDLKTADEMMPSSESLKTMVPPPPNNESEPLNRKKRQSMSLQEQLYYRRLEYDRMLRQREQQIRDYHYRRRQHEEEIRRMNHQNRVMQELRRVENEHRNNYHNYHWERRERERRLRQERRRLEIMALMQNEGELTGEEQFFTISAHNLLRREVGAKDLAWSAHLERWAKYVIRCETEYPGPISCYTNFGKAESGREIYNVVYEWGAEGNDVNMPLRYGCRTPYDKSLCNHNSIIRDKSLTQMACASKNCGYQRQLTCIYNSS